MARLSRLLCSLLLGLVVPVGTANAQRHVLPSTGSAAGSDASVWGAADCTVVTSPVAGSTWCFDLTDYSLKVYNGTTYAPSVGLTNANVYAIQDKYLIVGSAAANTVGQFGLVGSRTTNGGFAQLTFHNEAVGSGNRRVAQIQATRLSANDTAALEFQTAQAGSIELRLRLEGDGLTGTFMGIGVDPVEYLHIRTFQHGGIGLDRDANTLALDITFGTDGVVTTARDWVIRADSPGANGDFFRIMDIDAAGGGVSRLVIDGMKTLATNASWFGTRVTTSGVTVQESAAAGTHAIIATFAIDSLTVTNDPGVTTDLTSFYIAGAPTGISPTNTATALWVASGLSRFDGNVQFRRDTFANLGTPINGIIVYCSNCLPASNPCSGASTGAMAFRMSGAWKCL